MESSRAYVLEGAEQGEFEPIDVAQVGRWTQAGKRGRQRGAGDHGRIEDVEAAVPLQAHVQRVGIVGYNAYAEHVGVVEAVAGGARDPVFETPAVPGARGGPA